MKRDASDITRDEGPDALREAFDESVRQKQARDRQRTTQSGGRPRQPGARCRSVDVNDATIEYIQPSGKVG